MAEAVKPTNEEIVKMLEQVLRDLDDIKSRQQELSADIDKLSSVR